jgi:hypothetical protein
MSCPINAGMSGRVRNGAPRLYRRVRRVYRDVHEALAVGATSTDDLWFICVVNLCARAAADVCGNGGQRLPLIRRQLQHLAVPI